MILFRICSCPVRNCRGWNSGRSSGWRPMYHCLRFSNVNPSCLHTRDLRRKYLWNGLCRFPIEDLYNINLLWGCHLILHIIQHEHHPVIHPINPYNRWMKQELYTCHVINSFKTACHVPKGFLKTWLHPQNFSWKLNMNFQKVSPLPKSSFSACRFFCLGAFLEERKVAIIKFPQVTYLAGNPFLKPEIHRYIYTHSCILSQFLFFFTKVGWLGVINVRFESSYLNTYGCFQK